MPEIPCRFRGYETWYGLRFEKWVKQTLRRPVRKIDPVMLSPISLTLALLLCSFLIAAAYMAVDERA